MKSNANFFIYFSGLILGLAFPDFDYFLGQYIKHRSIFTHSIFIILIFIILTKNIYNLKSSNYIMGLTNGIVLHLISDLNIPSEMVGAQTIKFLSYDLGAFSFYFMLLNILIGLFVAERFNILIREKNREFLNLICGTIFLYLHYLYFELSSNIFIFSILFYIFLKIIFYFLGKKFKNLFKIIF
jgi:hypothetical protein